MKDIREMTTLELLELQKHGTRQERRASIAEQARRAEDTTAELRGWVAEAVALLGADPATFAGQTLPEAVRAVLAERDAMRAALEPFAAYYDALHGPNATGYAALPVAALRRARAALEGRE